MDIARRRGADTSRVAVAGGGWAVRARSSRDGDAPARPRRGRRRWPSCPPPSTSRPGTSRLTGVRTGGGQHAGLVSGAAAVWVRHGRGRTPAPWPAPWCSEHKLLPPPPAQLSSAALPLLALLLTQPAMGKPIRMLTERSFVKRLDRQLCAMCVKWSASLRSRRHSGTRTATGTLLPPQQPRHRDRPGRRCAVSTSPLPPPA
jgi:hypothetical protein